MRFGMLLTAVLAAVPHIAVASTAWPNEPANSVPLLDCSFDHPTCNGKLIDYYNTAGLASRPPSAYTLSVVQDSTAPLSPANVVRSTENYLVGNGGTQLQYYAPTRIKEIYVGFWWRTNPEFTGNRANANKTFFIRASQGGTNGVFFLRTNPGATPYFYWTTQQAWNMDQCGGVVPDQDYCMGNKASVPIQRGNWYRIEVYMKASSCLGTCHDGIVRWWITPKGGPVILAGDYKNFAYAQNVDEFVWSETWDGAGNGAGFTSDPSHYLDHLHISWPNGVAGIRTDNASSGSRFSANLVRSRGLATFQITLPKKESISLNVFNAQGKNVWTHQAVGENRVDIPWHAGSSAKAGVYVLQVRQGQNACTTRFFLD